jgi:acetyl esterase/lipase
MLRRQSVALLLACAAWAQEPKAELLWPQGAPGAKGAQPEDQPALTAYLPPKDRAARVAVVVCPGGGYRTLAMDHEGRQIAQWLNTLGVAAFVLQYRLGPRYQHPAMIDDAHEAIRTVRRRAAEFNIDPAKVGIWGFSAGGHLASTAATHFDDATRPDFAILSYPVITLTNEAYVHKGSRLNLLGEQPDPKVVESLSNELQVTPRTPPVFLVHTHEDTTVPPENAVLFYLALRKAGVPAEMHIYERGRHGLGLGQTDAAFSSWPARLADWLRTRGILR